LHNTIPSYVTLPKADVAQQQTILEFLVKRFPNIEKQTWEMRIKEHKILDEANSPINFDTPYRAHMRLTYFREVQDEIKLPFKSELLFESEQILICDKPHFLPVIPAGPYVNESLLNRLKLKTGNLNLTPVHRLDRETAGLVMISKKKETRGLYHNLFLTQKVKKEYEALTQLPKDDFRSTTVETNITQGEPFFRMQQDQKKANSKTVIHLINKDKSFARMKLFPQTGKKHQLRLHLSFIGCPIVNDNLYPELQPESVDDFNNPLKLLAKTLHFTDPVTRKDLTFNSKLTL
jgi:tRNA pseudouridine32 synthase/23S rRNA pseudouridine746 synthase